MNPDRWRAPCPQCAATIPLTRAPRCNACHGDYAVELLIPGHGPRLHGRIKALLARLEADDALVPRLRAIPGGVELRLSGLVAGPVLRGLRPLPLGTQCWSVDPDGQRGPPGHDAAAWPKWAAAGGVIALAAGVVAWISLAGGPDVTPPKPPPVARGRVVPQDAAPPPPVDAQAAPKVAPKRATRVVRAPIVSYAGHKPDDLNVDVSMPAIIAAVLVGEARRGVGFVVAQQPTMILAPADALDDREVVQVLNLHQEQAAAEVLAINPPAALLRVEDPRFARLQTIPLGHAAELKKWAPVFSVGTPNPPNFTATFGLVEQPVYAVEGAPWIKVDLDLPAPVSGGAIFNTKAELVGLFSKDKRFEEEQLVEPIEQTLKGLAKWLEHPAGPEWAGVLRQARERIDDRYPKVTFGPTRRRPARGPRCTAPFPRLCRQTLHFEVRAIGFRSRLAPDPKLQFIVDRDLGFTLENATCQPTKTPPAPLRGPNGRKVPLVELRCTGWFHGESVQRHLRTLKSVPNPWPYRLGAWGRVSEQRTLRAP